MAKMNSKMKKLRSSNDRHTNQNIGRYNIRQLQILGSPLLQLSIRAAYVTILIKHILYHTFDLRKQIHKFDISGQEQGSSHRWTKMILQKKNQIQIW